MDPEHLHELIQVERAYWWHVAKRELVLGLLRRHAPPPGLLVEGGLGGGANALAFQRLGYDLVGFDLAPEAVAHGRSLGLERATVLDLHDPWPIPPRSARAIVLLDVIEHLADPEQALRNAAAALRADGSLIVTVPAIPSLMGPWDRMLGHHRRYSRPLLREHAARAGLAVRWVSAWNSFTLPAAYLVRMREKRRDLARSPEFPPVPNWLNSALIGMARVERAAMRACPVPLGLSLVAVLGPPPERNGRHGVDSPHE